MPIPEGVVVDEFLPLLPPDSWLQDYICHGYCSTTAPVLFHCGVGLATLAATCPSDLMTEYGLPTYANTFCLLTGASGDYKSTAARIGSRMLSEAMPNLLGTSPASREGMFDSLAAKPRQLIVWSEFGDFLASTKKGQGEGIKTFLTDAYDCIPLGTSRARNKDNATRPSTIARPRLSIAGAVSLSYLEEHTLTTDWSGGFLRRWLIMYGETNRSDSWPTGDADLTRRDRLVQELKNRAILGNSIDQTLGGTPINQCVGLDPSARPVWDAWYKKVNNSPIPAKVDGAKTSFGPMAVRIALILSWDYGQAYKGTLGQPFLLGLDVLLPAMFLVDLHIQGLIALSANLAEHPTARLRRLVLRVFKDHPGQPLYLPDLTKQLKLIEKEVAPILSTLYAEGQVTRARGEGGPCYFLPQDNVLVVD